MNKVNVWTFQEDKMKLGWLICMFSYRYAAYAAGSIDMAVILFHETVWICRWVEVCNCCI